MSFGPARRSALQLVIKGAVLLLAVYATAAAIVALVPEVNDYAKASLLKHHRLSESPGRRIVLIGGSNLAYGIDSSIVEQMTGCTTANMGMNGRLGVRFLLEETRPDLRRGDIAVASLEYDGFYMSVEGDNADQLMVVKANPRAFTYLDWPQRQALAYAVPYVAQEKLVRLTGDTYYAATRALLRKPPPERPAVDMDIIESLEGFNERGDLVSHLGLHWPVPYEDGMDLTNEELDESAVPLLAAFADDMKARGVDVLLSYTPVMRGYFEQHKAPIEHLHGLLTGTSLVIPSPPDALVYDEELFFDTVYHLNAEGRKLRSTRIAQDIVRALGTSTPCRAPAAVAAGHH